MTMLRKEKNDNPSRDPNLENDEPTVIQKRLEQNVLNDESTLEGENLSIGLSKDRTHMSEHRTRMSEHRTDMSEHRTDLSEHRTDLSEHRTGLSDKRTNLSFERTALSYERTLMAWIRTATSLITFGFTIYKFFEEVVSPGHSARIITPRIVGMIMIAVGFLGLLFAQMQHQIAYKRLKNDYPAIQRSLSSILGALILVFGILLFGVVLFRQ
ncbi:MAG: DUF202 domain-containing protein [Chitinophagaceae bacterium]|nr:MAG: DUF202 domain-containing protein [Chitinophagaceae bacterium]